MPGVGASPINRDVNWEEKAGVSWRRRRTDTKESRYNIEEKHHQKRSKLEIEIQKQITGINCQQVITITPFGPHYNMIKSTWFSSLETISKVVLCTSCQKTDTHGLGITKRAIVIFVPLVIRGRIYESHTSKRTEIDNSPNVKLNETKKHTMEWKMYILL